MAIVDPLNDVIGHSLHRVPLLRGVLIKCLFQRLFVEFVPLGKVLAPKLKTFVVLLPHKILDVLGELGLSYWRLKILRRFLLFHRDLRCEGDYLSSAQQLMELFRSELAQAVALEFGENVTHIHLAFLTMVEPSSHFTYHLR